MRMRCVLGSSIYFTSFFPNVAFKRRIMVFILHILVYAELLLCLIVTLSQNATTGFPESSCDRFVLFREGAKRKVSVRDPIFCGSCVPKLSLLKGQLQRFYKLVSYERAVKILKNDVCITEIGQAVLEIFEFKVEFPRKIRNFANVSIIRVEQWNS